MQLSDAPAKIVEAFAVNGSKNTIPVPTQIPITPGAASYNDGFPPLTMTPVTSGGIPPSGLDMNGILNEATAVDNWMSAGAGFPFDATFATAIGGYPKGARVLMAAGAGYWLNLVDNNSNDPDTTSGSGGWIPCGGNLCSSVYASVQQTIAIGESKILWNSVDFDPFSFWDAADKRFTAQYAGKYRFSGALYLPAPAGQNLAVDAYQNGVLAKRLSQFPQTTDQDLTFIFSVILNCALFDYIEAFLNVPTTAVLAGQASGSSKAYVYGQLEYLGA